MKNLIFIDKADAIIALNEMLRCYDYGNSTTSEEWKRAAENARLVLKNLTSAKTEE